MYKINKPKYTKNYIQLSLPVGNIQHNEVFSNNSISKTKFARGNLQSLKNQPTITPIQLEFCFEYNKVDGSK
jgi:hypothetical protein